MSAKRVNKRAIQKTPSKKKVGVYFLPKEVREFINDSTDNQRYRKQMRDAAIIIKKKLPKKADKKFLQEYITDKFVDNHRYRFVKSISYKKTYTDRKTGKKTTKVVNTWVDRITGESGTWNKMKKPFLNTVKKHQIKKLMQTKGVGKKEANKIYSTMLKKKGQKFVFEILGS